GYHAERARHLLQAGKHEDSLRACDAALELSPDPPLPLMLRGRALLQLRRYEQAERSFDQYLRKGGEPAADVFRGRGLARMKQGKYREPARDYGRALERAPAADLYQHRGWAHFFAEAWKLALRDFSRAIELGPAAGDAHVGRGLAHVMLGDHRAAVTDAETALRRKPATPEMMHHVARILAQAVARAAADHHAPLTDYRRRALEAVSQTLEMLRPEERVAFWRDKVLPDAALAPIRTDARFKRLHEEYARP